MDLMVFAWEVRTRLWYQFHSKLLEKVFMEKGDLELSFQE